MPVIRRLPPTLVNRIAAGECVERPASVVKELMENAVDAGASHIDVQVVDGGRERILVVDDGCGMEPADLALCIQPHATSKLSDDDDLLDLRTLGFRGEALPSIGAVSRLIITSRTREAEIAHKLRVDAGEASPLIPCTAPVGTSVEVQDLFYCVPARRKFLRTAQSEMSHISEQFSRLALGLPGVKFSLTHGNRKAMDLPARSGKLERLRDLFGPELADVLMPVERDSGGLRLEGFVAPPAQARASGKWEYVFVNGRYVRDRFISHAVKEAHRSLMDPNRFPVVFLFLETPAGDVDVNVNPTKIEVRWRDSGRVHSHVLAALRERFLTSRLGHAWKPPANDEHRERVRMAMVDFFTHSRPRAVPLRPKSDAPAPGLPGIPSRVSTGEFDASSVQPTWGGRDRATGAGGEPGENTGSATAAKAFSSPADATRSHPTGAPDAGPPSEPALAPPRALQIHNAYLVVETEDGCMIIDQHALHERVLYEQLARRVSEQPLESQRLLFPDIVTVPADRAEVLEVHAELLHRLGVDLTAAGPNRVALHAFPSFLHRVERVAFVRELLELLHGRTAAPDVDALLHELLDMLACKAAVKAGDPLTPAEIAALLEQRQLTERSTNCPHGRPTTIHLTLRDLARQFHRR